MYLHSVNDTREPIVDTTDDTIELKNMITELEEDLKKYGEEESYET